MKCVLRAWGQLKRGFQVLALGEMCFEGMGAIEKGVSRCWHGLVVRAWGELKRGFAVLAQLQRGFEVLALGELCFEGMGAVEKGV